MPKLEIAEIEKSLNTCLGSQRLDQCGRKNGLEQRRHRGIPTSGLVCSLLASLGSRRVETLADLHRDFQAASESSVNYKPFYEKLDKPGFPRSMKEVFEHLLSGLSPRVLRPSRSSPLRDFEDIIIHDGSSVGLHEDLREAFPSRFTALHPAGAELHVTMSLWRQAAVQVRIAPDCKSERDFVPSAKSLRNKLFLADRGYDGVGYLSQIDDAGGFFAVRIRSKANPIIHRVLSGSKWLRRQVGQPLNDVLARASDSEFADLLVTYKARDGHEPRTFRLIVHKLRNPKKSSKPRDPWMRIVTNVSPQRLSKQQVPQLYRLRWQIELFFKELKSYANLQPFCTRKKAIAEGLFWASLCAATLKRFFAHACQLSRGIAAISPRRVAMCAHTFLSHILFLLQTKSRRLTSALEHAFDYLCISARRSNPEREKKRGLLFLGLAQRGLP
jgi:hypothetical protein